METLWGVKDVLGFGGSLGLGGCFGVRQLCLELSPSQSHPAANPSHGIPAARALSWEMCPTLDAELGDYSLAGLRLVITGAKPGFIACHLSPAPGDLRDASLAGCAGSHPTGPRSPTLPALGIQRLLLTAKRIFAQKFWFCLNKLFFF